MIKVLIVAAIVLVVVALICIGWVMFHCFRQIKSSQEHFNELRKRFEDLDNDVRKGPTSKTGRG